MNQMEMIGLTVHNIVSDSLAHSPIISEFQIITDEDHFYSLKNDWNSLWDNSSNAEFFQTFAYCWHSWQQIAKPSRCQLFCIVARQGCELKFVWPMVNYRKFIWKIIRPLGPCAAEYSHPLVSEELYAALYCSLAWQLIINSKVDIVNIPFLRKGSALDNVISVMSPMHTDCDVSAIIEWGDHANWQSYYNSLSKTHRRSHTKNWRKIHNLNVVDFEEIDDPEQVSQLIDWLLIQKQKWAAKAKGHKTGKWLSANEYKNFLISLAKDQGLSQRLVMCVLRLDDKISAAKLAAIGDKRADWIIAAYNQEFAKFSPGMILSEYCLRLAFERGLKVDFGVGNEEGKLFWSHGNLSGIVTYRFANSIKGYIGLTTWKFVGQCKDMYWLLYGRNPLTKS